jgi:hypothetical protein
MAMQIDIKRLEQLIAPQGYSTSWVSPVEQRVVYVKPSWHPELYELLDIHCSGKCGEAVPAVVRVGVFRGRAAGGDRSERMVLEDLASDKRRCWTLIRTPQEAIQWERQCAAIAPLRAAELASRTGQEILDRTASARNAADEYLRMLLAVCKPLDADTALRDRASHPQMHEALRIAEAPAVVKIPEGLSVYTTAALAIVLFGEQIERRPQPFWGDNPLYNHELMKRIQLIVDRMPHPANRSWQLPTPDDV